VSELALPLAATRLTLRAWAPSDRAAYLALHTDPVVGRYIPGLPESDNLAGENFAALCARAPDPSEPIGAWLAIATREADEVVGTGGVLWRDEAHRQAEFGVLLLPGAAGQGYATEAAQALIDAAFSQLGAHRVSAELLAENRSSARLCQRLGLRLEGLHLGTHLEGEQAYDSLTFAMVAAEWRQRR